MTTAIAAWTAATAITLCGAYFVLCLDDEDNDANIKRAIECGVFVVGLTILTPTLWYSFGYKITGNGASPFADPEAVADMQGMSHQEKKLLVKSILSRHKAHSGGKVEVIRIWHDVYNEIRKQADEDLKRVKERNTMAYSTKLKMWEDAKNSALSCVRFKANVYPALKQLRPTTYIGVVNMNMERVEDVTEFDPAVHTDFRG